MRILSGFLAPINEECNMTMIQMTNNCELSSRNYGVTVIVDEVMYQFEDVQLSSFINSQSLTYKLIRVNLSDHLPIPNNHYIIARPYSSRSAVYVQEDQNLNDEFLNDTICYYNVNNDENQDILKRIKDFLCIRVTDTYLFLVVLDLTKTLNDQIDIICEKFKSHNMNFSKEELRQKLSWSNKKN